MTTPPTSPYPETRQTEMIRAHQEMTALGFSEADVRDEQLRIAGRYRTEQGTAWQLEDLRAALYDGAPDVADLQVTPGAYRLILGLCWADMRPEGLWGRTVAQ